MKIAYFDCFAGVSGDMILGALIDLGVDVDALSALLKSIGIDSFACKTEQVNRNSITALNLTIKTDRQRHHRNLNDILNIINVPQLSSHVKDRIETIFSRIAAAESKVHQQPVNRIHFHEVGAVDSMIDIIGSVWGLEQLNIDRCYSSAISVGSGSIECEHGTLPVPVPATLELIKGFPVVKKEVGTELATPTGAAFITSVAEYAAQLPPMRILDTGYGCGDREFSTFPNILRIITGEPVTQFEEDTMLVVETNVDDLNSELIPYVMEQLLHAGAADVFITPVIMKKGRPGNRITVIIEKERLDLCVNILFRETTTLGVRFYETFRLKLERASERVQTPWGDVKVKTFIYNGKKQVVPEYEECKKIAENEKLPLIQVYDTIRRIGNPDD